MVESNRLNLFNLETQKKSAEFNNENIREMSSTSDSNYTANESLNLSKITM